MGEIKTILLSVQERLATKVPTAKYIDKDWGQLNYEQPAVKWPCLLLDIEEVKYSQEGKGHQQADTRIVVTVANMRLTASSQKAPRKEEAYKVIELLEEIHAALHGFSDGNFSPLFRSGLKKILAESSKECYQLTYETAFSTGFVREGEKRAPIQSVRLRVNED